MTTSTNLRRLLVLAIASLVAAVAPPAASPGRPRLAIRTIAATPAVAAQAKAEGSENALAQVEQAADPQLMDAMAATGRFELVARADLPSVMKEQDLSLSGNVDAMDPQAARAFRLAGAQFVATVTVSNFQDVTEETELLNQFGTSKAERRTVNMQATVKVFDTTSATMLAAKSVTLSEVAANEIMPGVRQKGSKTVVVLGQAARALAEQASAAIASAVPAAAAPAPASTGDGTAAAPSRPLRVAIFVKQRPASVPAEKVSVFEDLVSASASGPGLEVIRREDVLNAVSRIAPAGPNAGTGSPDADRFDRLLSDRASATGLAFQLRADALLTVSISSLQRNRRKLDDPSTGVATDVEQWTLATTYGIIDGATGASIGTGTVTSDYARRDSAGLTVEVDAIDALLRDAAARLGPAARSSAESARGRLAAVPGEVAVRLDAVLADLSVPDVRVDATGQYAVAPLRYDLQPMNVQIEVDGAVVGQCPGTVSLRPGAHRARFSRPGLEPVEMVINAREGLEVRVPMQLSPEGRENWRRDAEFFSRLKDGAVLRDAELIKVRAVADFLRQSDFRLDTSNVQNLNLGGQSLWWQLLR